MTGFIDGDKTAMRLRSRIVEPDHRRLLIADLSKSQQKKDLTKPPNCGGFGRVRHFRVETSPNWPEDPLPIEPACRALGLDRCTEMQAQVFQVAACNWRCWYCFVDYSLLSADPRHAAFLAVSDLVDLYLEELERPRVIDLSGGNPSLVPEWVPWMMQELQRRGLEKEVYLWSDDNLSNEYFWHYLTKAEIELIRGYPNYGKVCCFKGFDGTSFSYNTGASPDFFDRQFEIMKRLLCLGLDIYCYATFTTPTTESIYERMARFIDRQQELDPYLPLRTVPLEIEIYEPVKSRLKRIPTEAMIGQKMAIEAWTRELNARYSDDDLGRRITDIPLQGQNVSQRFRHTEEVN